MQASPERVNGELFLFRMRAKRSGDLFSTQVMALFSGGVSRRRLRRCLAAVRLVPTITIRPSASKGTPVGIGSQTVANPSKIKTAANDHQRIFIS